MKKITEFLKGSSLPKKADETHEQLAKLYKLHNDFPMIDRFVGIEIEVEHMGKSESISTANSLGSYLHRYWNITTDDSLRNNGREFVSMPLNRQGLINGLLILNKLIGFGGNPTYSNRCSVHLHFDLSDLTIDKFVNLILTYLYVEPIIFELPVFVGLKNRKNNIFCVPSGSSVSMFDLAKIMDVYQRTPPENLGIDFVKSLTMGGDANRYHAFNLGALWKHGTIEFRHFPGTHDPKALMMWINCINNMFEFAKEHTTKELFDKLSALNSNSQYHQLIYSILGNLPLGMHRNLFQELEDSVKLIKRVYSLEKKLEWIPDGSYLTQVSKLTNIAFIKKPEVESFSIPLDIKAMEMVAVNLLKTENFLQNNVVLMELKEIVNKLINFYSSVFDITNEGIMKQIHECPVKKYLSGFYVRCSVGVTYTTTGDLKVEYFPNEE